MNSKKRPYCVGGQHFSNTNYITEYEKLNPITNEFAKLIGGKIDICSRSKSQSFTM